MNFRNNLPAGMENLGPIDDLDLSKLLNPEATSLKKPPVSWQKTGDGQWIPTFSIPGLAEETTMARPTKELLPTERSLVVNLFTNHVGHYLFGVNPFIIQDTPEGTSIEPNPEFFEL